MINESDTILIDVTQEMWQKAVKDADSHSAFKNSMLEGKGDTCGFLGECGTLLVLKGAVLNNDFDRDILYNCIEIDCKSKRRKSSFYDPNFELSIWGKNPKQKCDAYVFSSIAYSNGLNQPATHIRVVGWMPKMEFFEGCVYHQPGESAANMHNGGFTDDCFNRFFKELRPISELVNIKLKEVQEVNNTYANGLANALAKKQLIMDERKIRENAMATLFMENKAREKSKLEVATLIGENQNA